ncbi:hypothetical protein PS2_038473 [Malus domestica]
MTVHHLLPLLPSDSPLMDRTGGLWRIASNFLRSFSTASQNPTSATGSSSASKKPKRKKKKKNLFEVAQFLPNWGLGYRMAKTHWVGVSYQIINLYKIGKYQAPATSKLNLLPLKPHHNLYIQNLPTNSASSSSLWVVKMVVAASWQSIPFQQPPQSSS